MAQQPLVGQGLLMVETSRSHSDTPHSVGLLRTSDQPDLTTHNTHKRQTFLPPAGFEPTIPAKERPQTHALDGAATGIAVCQYSDDNFVFQNDSTVDNFVFQSDSTVMIILCFRATVQ